MTLASQSIAHSTRSQLMLDSSLLVPLQPSTQLMPAAAMLRSIDTQIFLQTTKCYAPSLVPEVMGSCANRECIHRASGEKYAVKTIEKSKIARQDHIRREIELLCSIDHPGIMKIVDFYEDAACVHIITEMYTGGELFDAVINNTTEHGCLPEFAAVEIIKSLLEAVRYLHDNDIVHRDIKAENILFADEECSSIKLIDFGLSRNHGQNDAYMTNPVGSLYYQSPGILTHKYDRSCDLWSIGVLTYILICGYPPFNVASNDEVHNATLDGNVVFEERIWGKFSRESIDFVSKLLCTDARKIGTAAEALDHPWIVHS
eukprot:95983_1